MIKESKLKAQASIQGDTVRVVSKDKDVLQPIMGKLRAGDFGVALQFTNLPQLTGGARKFPVVATSAFFA